ncbi:MAG: hypothetical protein IT318_26475 [Anaerolineales bacterium]|nr:hypothetical protein [Anaerolineales bacterium]
MSALAWRTSFKLVGWWPTALSGLAIALGLAFAADSPELLPRVVEVIVPLAFGAQAAFVLAPDSEPPLELLLASPRPVPWALWERLLVLAGLQGSVALVASVVTLSMAPDYGLAQVIARWLAPSAFLGGVAILAAQVTRQGVFGALLATLLWASMLFGGDALLSRWPSLWPLHLFLQPGATAPALYAANRASLLAAGLGMVALAPRLLADEERALDISRAAERR